MCIFVQRVVSTQSEAVSLKSLAGLPISIEVEPQFNFNFNFHFAALRVTSELNNGKASKASLCFHPSLHKKHHNHLFSAFQHQVLLYLFPLSLFRNTCTKISGACSVLCLSLWVFQFSILMCIQVSESDSQLSNRVRCVRPKWPKKPFQANRRWFTSLQSPAHPQLGFYSKFLVNSS